MALVGSRAWPERSAFWSDWPERNWVWRDRFNQDWTDWPVDWPRPREIFDKFRSNSNADRWWREWPSYWPRFDAVIPRFTSHLDRYDRNWRDDPFWRDLYPRWAEPIFKDGIDVKTNIVNDDKRFAVEIDCYQFRPEELQVKTLDDTLLIEGRHENVKDPDNYTKMYFVRKYQLPFDVESQTITSSVDSSGRLMVEAAKRPYAIDSRERAIPIESAGSRMSSYYDSGRGSSDLFRGNNNGPGGGNLSPNNGGYRTAYESRQTNDGGLHHEARREEFREEVRRTGSHQSIPPPISPIPIRTDSRQNRGEAFERSYQRSASASRNEFRSADVNGDHLLRPTDELSGGRQVESRQGERSIRINRS